MKSAETQHIGLDFGTSTTLLARSVGVDGVLIEPLTTTTRWLPSIAGVVDRSSEIVVAEATDRLPLTQIIRSVKRAITLRSEWIEVTLPDGTHNVSADDAAAAIVREALHRVNGKPEFSNLSAVRVGCPAMWDADQRERLRRILQAAGVEVHEAEVIDEPIAVALSWVTEQQRQHRRQFDGLLAVFDYGGGTLDIAICLVRWAEGRPDITVLASEGIGNAGDNIDDALIDYLRRKHFKTSEPLTPVQVAALGRAVTSAKEALSSVSITDVLLELYGLTNVKLSRDELEAQFAPILEPALSHLMYALRGAMIRDQAYDDNVRPTDQQLRQSVGCVLLTGGTSKIPLVAKRIGELFSCEVELVGSGPGGAIRGPQEAVVAGLVYDPARYSQLNLHRPSFDVWLEWQRFGGQPERQRLYRAHTPLYGMEDFARMKHMLGCEVEFRIPDGARVEQCHVVLRSVSGSVLPLRLLVDSEDSDPVSDELNGLPISGNKVFLKLYVDGRILLRVNDAAWRYRGAEGFLFLKAWPLIRTGTYKQRPIELTIRRSREMARPSHPGKY